MVATLTAKHKESVPLNNLSIADNLAGTESIIKVAGVDKNYNGPLPRGQLIDIYDETDRAGIFAFFYSPAWQPAGD